MLVLAPLGGSAGQPKSFVKEMASPWQVFELRADIDFPHAWDDVFALLVNDFDIAVALKEDGYVRTDWNYYYGGNYNFQYRVRVTVLFTPDRKTMKTRVDAQFKDGDNWILGVDSRLLATLKTDIMGTIGRTTR